MRLRFWFAAPALLLCVASCGRVSPPPPAPRVILLGIDGGSWSVLDPLIAEGKLPHFAKMRREGVSGTLKSVEPIFSPIAWATISTGKLPDKHGIQSFTVELEGRPVPVTSNLLRASRIWDVLSDRDRTVGVIGWWTTWPATPVNGFMCSDRTWPITMGEHGWAVTSAGEIDLAKRTYPESLYEEIQDLIVRRDDLTEDDMRVVDVSGPLATLGTLGSSAADMYAKDITFTRIASRLYPTTRPDFFSLYLELTDVMAHYFWDFWRFYRYRKFGEESRFTEAPREQPPPKAAWIGKNYEGSYVFADSALGVLMDAADDSTLIMIVSDHGYGANETGDRIHIGDDMYAKIPHWHVLDGVLLAWGYGVKRGSRISGASVMDVTPTLLYAMGEPVGDDMDGRVLTGIFESVFAERPVERIPTHDAPGRLAPGEPLPSPEDEEYLEVLRSLGYVR